MDHWHSLQKADPKTAAAVAKNSKHGRKKNPKSKPRRGVTIRSSFFKYGMCGVFLLNQLKQDAPYALPHFDERCGAEALRAPRFDHLRRKVPKTHHCGTATNCHSFNCTSETQ